MRRLIFLGAVLLWLGPGCEADPYLLYIPPDGAGDVGVDADGPGDGATEAGDGLGDGTADACIPDGKGEVCDGKDNDCNGKVDDVPASMVEKDLKHCGKCFAACAFPNGFAKCEKGVCSLTGCAPGYYNYNGKDSDGCEYFCLVTNKGVETCDAKDNDCDGKTDEDYNLQADPKNCGTCGVACVFNNATGACVAGKCKISICAKGFANVDKNDANGCEYKCPVWPILTTDDCDGLDSDCDGKTDEDFVAGQCGKSVGQCKQGVFSCSQGVKTCSGYMGPSTEICDGLDNDCDGTKDNGFDKLNDPRYCQNCKACSLPNAVANCKNSVCGIAVCKSGWVNLDKKDANGCEYKCSITGMEICDGLDNDCDGVKDNGVSLTQSICKQVGPCNGAKAVCKGKAGWQCAYGADVELQPCKVDADCGAGYSCVAGVCPGVVITDEKLCDGKDGDCDGVKDDPWTKGVSGPLLGASCSPDPSKKGACAPVGAYACAANKTSLACTQTAAGQVPTNELCNGVDDDCDGKVDEATDDGGYKGVRDKVVRVKRSYGGKSYDFYIYAYEASRPDANFAAAGTSTARACSKHAALPWSKVTYKQAAAACKQAGRRLCSATEWLLACEGASKLNYPYGSAYTAANCNGLDKKLGFAMPAGSLVGCQGGETGLWDMSGNLREWTTHKAGTAGSKGIYVVRGGAYHTPGPGLTCAFTLSQAVEDVVLPTIGFRCCSNAP